MAPSTSIIITGATGSLGGHIALQLTRLFPQEYHLVLAARNISNDNAKGLSAKLAGLDASYSWETLDLSSLDNVADFTDRVAASIKDRKIPRLHGLINSAAVQLIPVTKTVDGFDLEYQTNVLAPILLTQKLQPLLQHGVVVNVSSSTHASGKHDYFKEAQKSLDADIGKVYGTAQGLQIYGTGKLMLMMAGYALTRDDRFATTRIIAADSGGMTAESNLAGKRPLLLVIVHNVFVALRPLLRIFWPSAMNPPEVPAEAISNIVHDASEWSSAFYVLERPKISAAIGQDEKAQNQTLDWINQDLDKWL